MFKHVKVVSAILYSILLQIGRNCACLRIASKYVSYTGVLHFLKFVNEIIRDTIKQSIAVVKFRKYKAVDKLTFKVIVDF